METYLIKKWYCYRVRFNGSWFGTNDKVLNSHDRTLGYRELSHDDRKKWKSMNLSMDLWHSYNIKVILSNFAKHHCFWALWTVNYADCISFYCIDSFHYSSQSSQQFKKILFSNFRKHTIKPPSVCKGFYKISPVSLSICLPVRLWRIFLRNYQVDFLNFLHEDILPYVLKKRQSDKLENCICCVDNWINQTSLDQRRNILHFNEDTITFCALNNAP